MKFHAGTLVLGLAVIAGRLPAQQPMRAADALAQQERAAARLDAGRLRMNSAAYGNIRAAMRRRSGSEGEHALIGALVGAIVVPTTVYLATHNSDSGDPSTGGILLLGAIGAFLGAMVGLSIGHH